MPCFRVGGGLVDSTGDIVASTTIARGGSISVRYLESSAKYSTRDYVNPREFQSNSAARPLSDATSRPAYTSARRATVCRNKESGMFATYGTPSLRLEVLQRASLLRGLPCE